MGDEQPWEPGDLAAKADIDAGHFFTVDFGPVIGVRRTSARVTNYDEDELGGAQFGGALGAAIA
jgi:hypothetical protein